MGIEKDFHAFLLFRTIRLKHTFQLKEHYEV
jgi:hypothetical protein